VRADSLGVPGRGRVRHREQVRDGVPTRDRARDPAPAGPGPPASGRVPGPEAERGPLGLGLVVMIVRRVVPSATAAVSAAPTVPARAIAIRTVPTSGREAVTASPMARPAGTTVVSGAPTARLAGPVVLIARVMDHVRVIGGRIVRAGASAGPTALLAGRAVASADRMARTVPTVGREAVTASQMARVAGATAVSGAPTAQAALIARVTDHVIVIGGRIVRAGASAGPIAPVAGRAVASVAPMLRTVPTVGRVGATASRMARTVPTVGRAAATANPMARVAGATAVFGVPTVRLAGPVVLAARVTDHVRVIGGRIARAVPAGVTAAGTVRIGRGGVRMLADRAEDATPGRRGRNGQLIADATGTRRARRACGCPTSPRGSTSG
jgi:hypothetical protein